MINSNPVNGFPGPSTGPEFVVGNCIEAKVNFPGPSGDEAYNWPAWWASGADWPANGEEDIFESYNGTPSALNYHSVRGANNGPFPCGTGATQFHTYTCVRGPSTISVYWDGTLVRSVTLVDDGGPQSILVLIGAGNTAETRRSRSSSTSACGPRRERGQSLMPCFCRRGCAERFRDLDGGQLLAILAHHGSCGGCGNDVTDNPRFADSADGIPVPYCPACFEERWPTGAEGPFERGKPQVYRLEALADDCLHPLCR